jgi:hypothetical protein
MGRKNDQIAQAAEPLMQPGEIVEATAMAVLGKFNYGKSVALGIATGIATLGMVSVMTTPKQQPLVITTRRFLVLGKFNYGKSVALGIATGIATLGMVSVMTTPKQQPLVITTRRFLVLGMKTGIVDKPDSKIVTEIPREDLRARPAKRVFTYFAVDLTDPQGNKLTRLKFPFWKGGEARSFSQALGEPAGVGVSR